MDTQIHKLLLEEVNEAANTDFHRPPSLAKLIKIYLQFMLFEGQKRPREWPDLELLWYGKMVSRARVVPSPCVLCRFGLREALAWGEDAVWGEELCSYTDCAFLALPLWAQQNLGTSALAAFPVSVPSSSRDSTALTLVGSQFSGKQILCF